MVLGRPVALMDFLDGDFLAGAAGDGVVAAARVGFLRATFFAGLALGDELLVFVLTAVFFSATGAKGAMGLGAPNFSRTGLSPQISSKW